jgi:hypothetical protein
MNNTFIFISKNLKIAWIQSVHEYTVEPLVYCIVFIGEYEWIDILFWLLSAAPEHHNDESQWARFVAKQKGITCS